MTARAMSLARIKRLYTVGWLDSDPEDVRVADVLARKLAKADPRLVVSMRERGQPAPIELRTDPWSGKVDTPGEEHTRVAIADMLGWRAMYYVIDRPDLAIDPAYDAGELAAPVDFPEASPLAAPGRAAGASRKRPTVTSGTAQARQGPKASSSRSRR